MSKTKTVKMERMKKEEVRPNPRDHALTTLNRQICPIKMVDYENEIKGWLEDWQVD
uniref:Uncharacterized protein n=1 Tax=Peronospora matthiolae TaxID=2874970 RepID=A0AAV1TIP1_9STRA